MARRVGIIGYGNLGKYLTTLILNSPKYELAFIWNRTSSKIDLDERYILDDISNFAETRPDIVVEVAHPAITKCYGKIILNHCDYMMKQWYPDLQLKKVADLHKPAIVYRKGLFQESKIGSPTALCDENLLKELQDAATDHGLYVPSGAFWGGDDIQKMSDVKQLKSLTVTMRKHPLSLKLEGHLKEKNMQVKDNPVTLFEGPVRDICALAPHNTNTMAVAAIAASNLGFDNVIGCLISDPSLINYHIVEVEAFGFPREDGSRFHVHTIRRNPADLGEVTGQATYAAYFGSLKRAEGKGPGVHLC